MASEELQKSTDFQGNYMEKFKDHRKNKHFPGPLLSWEQEGSKFLFYGEETVLELTVLSESILRHRYSAYGHFKRDFSYAVSPDFTPTGTDIIVLEDEEVVSLATPVLKWSIDRSTFATKIENLAGLVVLEDEMGYHWEENRADGGNIVICSKKLNSKEAFFGLGDKPCELNLRGRRLQNYGADTYGYGPETDPIYKNIPFFLGLHHKVGYGVFFDNSFRTFFDFGAERQNVFSYWAQGGEMDYYFIYGPETLAVAEQYAQLTGTPELPPMWALGYQQSKWSYYPEKQVRDLAKQFRKERMPCDVIYLDIDYMDGYRCFTWDNDRFPDPAKLMADLRAEGFRTVVIIDPGIKVDKDYWVHQEGLEQDLFCKRQDGDLMRGSVWPGVCHFPDYTNPKAREWWAGLYKEFMNEGIAGVWNDMNEPAVFEEGTFPNDVRHDYDGDPCSHRKAHNVYGMQMARATYEGVKQALPKNRPFVLTRSTYSGGQRHAAAWTGDNVASWEHLQVANIQCQRLAASGYSFIGTDVGGFIETPDGELFTRWVQLAIFHPFMRVHSSGDHGDQEPWSFGKPYTDIVRNFVEMRYRLLGYLYTAFWQYSTRGTPMLRSLFMVDQEDTDIYGRQDEFMAGDSLLVCPIQEKGSEGRWIYFPKGHWYNYWDDMRFFGFGEEIWTETKLTQLPIFVKAGAVVPLLPAKQHVDEKPVDELELHAYFSDGPVKSEYYEDAGEGYAYQDGESLLHTFTLQGSHSDMTIDRTAQGSFQPEYTSVKLVMHGLPFKPTELTVDGKKVKFSFDPATDKATTTLKPDFAKLVLRVTS